MAALPRELRPYLCAALAVEAVFVALHFGFPESRLFDLDREYTVPAWFSALQLAAIGLVSFVAYEAERAGASATAPRPPVAWMWLPIGVGFLYLSADEVLALHERVLTDELRALIPADSIVQGVLPWQLVFAPAIVGAFVSVAAMLYTRLAAEPRLRTVGVAALALWCSSFVFEGAAKPLFIPAGLYPLEVALEEAAEMAAGTCLLVAFASYVVLRLRGEAAVVEVRWSRVALASLGLTVMAGTSIAAVTASNPHYLHRRAGDKFAEEKEYDRAMAAYREAIKLAPDDADVWRRLARAALNGRDYETSADAYERAIALEPDEAALHNDLGVVLFHAGEYERAEQAYRAAVEARPAYARAHKNLGVLYEKLGDPQRAEQAYRRAVRHDDGMADAHRYLGNLLARTGREPEASRHWRRSLEIDPSQTGAPDLRRKLVEVSREENPSAVDEPSRPSGRG